MAAHEAAMAVFVSPPPRHAAGRSPRACTSRVRLVPGVGLDLNQQTGAGVMITGGEVCGVEQAVADALVQAGCVEVVSP